MILLDTGYLIALLQPHDTLHPKACRWVPASPELLEKSLALHRTRTDKDWSLTDCSSFVIMSERQMARALSYDHHFEQAGFEALLRREP